MANRRFDRDWTLGQGRVRIYGSFAVNGSSTPVAANVRGFGFGYAPNSAGVMALQPNRQSINLTTTPGILHSTTGTFTITLEDPYADLDSFICSAQLAVLAGVTVLAGPTINLGSSTAAPVLTIFAITTSTGAAVDTAAATNNRINFEAIFRNSTEQFGKP